MEVGGEGDYISLHCHHQNDSCINMGSNESHFNVSVTVSDKVKRQCPQITTFEEKGEPKQIRTEVPLLTSRSNRLTSFSSMAHSITFILVSSCQLNACMNTRFAACS